MRRSLLFVSAAVLLVSCGGNNGQEEMDTADTEGIPHHELSVNATIGVELGDSNYVFGQIQEAVPLSDGGVAVLDANTMNIRVFDASGGYRATFGRQGTGPGELGMPSGMALLNDGRIVISDFGSGLIHIYDDSLQWDSEISGFFPRPPRTVISAGGVGFTGLQRTFDREEGLMGYSVIRLEEGPDPVVVYVEDMYPFDTSMMGPMGEERMPLFTSDDSGRVFVAMPRSDLIEITGYTSDGQIFLEISQDVDPVAKTEEELALEEEEFNEFAERRGGGGGRMSGMELRFDPEPNRMAVSELGVDRSSRLWVRLGTIDYPFWNVYDMSGLLLMTTSLSIDDPDLDYMSVRIEDEGAAAWVEDPTTWPMVRILDLPE